MQIPKFKFENVKIQIPKFLNIQIQIPKFKS